MSFHHLLRQQHGIVTRRQMLGTGQTDHQIRRRIKVGELIPLHPGVYRHGAVAPSWLGSLMAAVLSSNGIGAHLSSAHVWRLELGFRPPIEVAVPADRPRRVAGAAVYRTSQWSAIARTVRQGVPVTGIERTVLDCAHRLTPGRLETMAESAIRRRLTSWWALRDVVVAQGRRGRNGSAGLRELIEARLGDPVVPLSDFSRLVTRLLTSSGLPTPVLEHRVHGSHGRFLMQVDLAWPQQGCIVELDGLEHHFGRRDRERDIAKRARVRAEGWRMIEVGWSMYRDTPDELVSLVRRFLSSEI